MQLASAPAAVHEAQEDAPAFIELRAPARLLEYRRGALVAFAAHTTMGLVDRPRVVAVPGAPCYCVGLMAWEGRQVPLLDLAALLRASPGDEPPAAGHVLVLAYQSAPGRALEYGAVCAPALVRMTEVADSQACPLPDDSDLWPWIALSCFEHEGRPVPVLDTARLFGAPQVTGTRLSVLMKLGRHGGFNLVDEPHGQCKRA